MRHTNISVRHCVWVNIIGITHFDGHCDKWSKMKMISKVKSSEIDTALIIAGTNAEYQPHAGFTKWASYGVSFVEIF